MLIPTRCRYPYSAENAGFQRRARLVAVVFRLQTVSFQFSGVYILVLGSDDNLVRRYTTYAMQSPWGEGIYFYTLR